MMLLLMKLNILPMACEALDSTVSFLNVTSGTLLLAVLISIGMTVILRHSRSEKCEDLATLATTRITHRRNETSSSLPSIHSINSASAVDSDDNDNVDFNSEDNHSPTNVIVADSNCPFQARLSKCLKRSIKRRGCKQLFQQCVENVNGDGSTEEDDETKSVLVPPLPLRRNRRRSQCQTTSGSPETSSSSTLRTQSCPVPTLNVVLIPRLYNRSSSASLIDMARMQQWQLILQRCHDSSERSIKRQAKQIDADGLYPLHWALAGGAPHQVLFELLRVYKRAAKKTDRQGSTALHFACHYGASSKVVRLLLEAYPESVHAIDCHGRYALFHAVSKGCSLDTLHALVEINPSAVLARGSISGRRTPLYIAWMDVVRENRRRQCCSHGRGYNSIVRSKKWEKAVFLLLAAYHNAALPTQSQLQDRHGILVPVLNLLSYLPTGVLQLVLDAYPESAKQRDAATGQLPLLLAASVVAKDKSTEAIAILLDAFPEASRVPDNSGRTGLELAVASGKHWDEGVDRLFEAAPEYLARAPSRIDTFTTIPLFALAAMKKDCQLINRQQPGRELSSGSEFDSGHLSTAYHLLRNDPSAIRNYTA